MHVRILSVCLLLSASSAVWSAESSAPPTQQLIRIDATGQWQIYRQVMECYPVTEQRTVTKKIPEAKVVKQEVDGQVVEKTVTVYKDVAETHTVTVVKTACKTVTQPLHPETLKAFETDGRPIPADKLKSRIVGDTLVVVSADGEMIADYYAALFKPGTIVLAMPALPPAVITPPVPAAPAPAAVPAPAPSTTGVSREIPVRTVASANQAEPALPAAARTPDYPNTMAPIFVFASREGADDVNLRRLTESTLQSTGYKIQRQGTGRQMVPVTMKQTVRHNEITTIAGKHLRFTSGDAASIPFDRVKEKLSRETTVLYSADGDDVDPFWLQNLKSTTLVLVGPQLPGGCGPAMPAMSAPVVAPSTVPPAAPVVPGPVPLPRPATPVAPSAPKS